MELIGVKITKSSKNDGNSKVTDCLKRQIINRPSVAVAVLQTP